MRLTALMGASLLALGGCAGSDTGADGAATAEVAVAAPAEVHITARDFAFDAPATIPSGWTTLVLHNEGPNLHHLMFVRLTEGKTLSDLEAAIEALPPGELMPPSWAVPMGGPNPPDAGAQTRAIIDVEPGDYALVCIVDTPDHIPHMKKGMVRGITVVPAQGAPVPEPTADMTVNLVDFAFAPDAPFTAGHHVLKVVNDGTQPHEIEVVRLGEGKTMDDLARWGQTFEGDLPGSSLGGIAPIAPGQTAYVPMELTPGDYAVLCFVPDPTHGNVPHLAQGMVLTFSIS